MTTINDPPDPARLRHQALQGSTMVRDRSAAFRTTEIPPRHAKLTLAPSSYRVQRFLHMAHRDTVLLVANYESDVGYAWWLMENFWVEISREMLQQKRRCILAYPVIKSVPDSIQGAPLEIIQARIRPTSLFACLRSAWLMRVLRVRSIYLSDWPSFSIVYALWRLAGVRRIVLHYHTFSEGPDPTGLRAWCKAAIHRIRFVSCDTYVGVSEYIQRRFIDNWKVPAERCIAIRNGIRVFSCIPNDVPPIRQTLGFRPDDLLVTLVGRATVHKGWDFSLRCLKELCAGDSGLPAVHFVFCGDGPDLETFRRLAVNLDLSSRAHFLGRRSDVRRVLCASNIAFHPSRGEALSLAILEFMCAGLPVIVPDIRSVCQTVTDGRTGLIYRANQLEDAVAALRKLVLNAELRSTLGAAARDDVLNFYRLELTNESFVKAVIPRL